MSHLLESLMYQASQVFLFPTLLVITVLFVYAFFLLGMFAMQWWQRRQGQGGQPTRGHHLLAWAKAQPDASADELAVKAPQLDRLAQVRREAAEIHLRCIAQVRQTLPPEQYARLLALAQPAAR